MFDRGEKPANFVPVEVRVGLREVSGGTKGTQFTSFTLKNMEGGSPRICSKNGEMRHISHARSNGESWLDGAQSGCVHA